MALYVSGDGVQTWRQVLYIWMECTHAEVLYIWVECTHAKVIYNLDSATGNERIDMHVRHTRTSVERAQLFHPRQLGNPILISALGTVKTRLVFGRTLHEEVNTFRLPPTCSPLKCRILDNIRFCLVLHIHLWRAADTTWTEENSNNLAETRVIVFSDRIINQSWDEAVRDKSYSILVSYY